MSKYDVAIAYRIYPLVSKIPAIFPDSKIKLAEFCIQSFKNSLGDLKPKIWCILDGCPNEYRNLFLKYFNPDSLVFIETDSIGNQATFKLQIDILASQTDSDYIFFAEDDYYYEPNQFCHLLLLLKENPKVDFVTPYDHLDYYKLPFHNYSSQIYASSTHYWHKVSSTCLTFLTTKNALLESKDIFLTYINGDLDSSIWLALTKMNFFSIESLIKGILSWDTLILGSLYRVFKFNVRQILWGKKYTLMAPIPTIGTHLESGNLSPGVDWGSKFTAVQSDFHIAKPS